MEIQYFSICDCKSAKLIRGFLLGIDKEVKACRKGETWNDIFWRVMSGQTQMN